MKQKRPSTQAYWAFLFASHKSDAALIGAVREGASVRFRQVIMTGISTIFAALPLVLASGAIDRPLNDQLGVQYQED